MTVDNLEDIRETVELPGVPRDGDTIWLDDEETRGGVVRGEPCWTPFHAEQDVVVYVR